MKHISWPQALFVALLAFYAGAVADEWRTRPTDRHDIALKAMLEFLDRCREIGIKPEPCSLFLDLRGPIESKMPGGPDWSRGYRFRSYCPPLLDGCFETPVENTASGDDLVVQDVEWISASHTDTPPDYVPIRSGDEVCYIPREMLSGSVEFLFNHVCRQR